MELEIRSRVCPQYIATNSLNVYHRYEEMHLKNAQETINYNTQETRI